jgi:hypothetical protein
VLTARADLGLPNHITFELAFALEGTVDGGMVEEAAEEARVREKFRGAAAINASRSPS